MTTENRQETLISALRNPSIFPHEDYDWQLIETHISWVILCGPYAYKIKKALDLGFLDCTTLDRRKFYCEEELRLNGRLAPDHYLQVVPITGTAFKPQLDGTAEVFEYAVKMKRFPQGGLLSEIVEDNRPGSKHPGAKHPGAKHLETKHIDELIIQVAEFHQNIQVVTENMPFGDPDQVQAPALDNFDQIRERIDNPVHLEGIKVLQEWTEKEYQRCYSILEQRKQRGFVRECHGDMHLGNMVMIDDVPLIFDGVDFNPHLYMIDVMSEVAFLFMDLENHGRRDYAFRFLNGYLEITGDYSGLQILRYYLVYRATVRAKVATISIDQHLESDSASSLAEFEHYLQLAVNYSRLQAPVLLITHGLSGSGKSTLSALLAEHSGMIRIRSDRERQRLLGKGNRKGKAANVDEGVYSGSATEKTYAVLEQLAAKTLEAGYSVIIDATFLTRVQRELFKRLANRLGIPIRILFFQAESSVLKQRVAARQSEGRDISEADLRVLAHQLDNYVGLDVDEQCGTVVIDTQLSCSGQEMLELIKQSLKNSSEPESYEHL